MSAITTHILDTSKGQPAPEVPVRLDFLDHGEWRPIGRERTDADGRAKGLVPADFEMQKGLYRLEFVVSDYFKAQNVKGFYPYVKIVFSVDDPATHYHVPLLLNPFGYSTYRGS